LKTKVETTFETTLDDEVLDGKRYRSSQLPQILQIEKGFTTVISLLMPIVLFLTVIASVGFGVLAAYVAVFGILRTFEPASQTEPSRPRLVLVPSQTHASGD
jgi:hypothetical protein